MDLWSLLVRSLIVIPMVLYADSSMCMNAHLWLTPEVTFGHTSRLLLWVRSSGLGVRSLHTGVYLYAAFCCGRLLKRKLSFHVG